MITRFSVVTLVFFILSITFVIYPVRIPVRLPWGARRKFTIPINLSTAPILAIAILWAAQCLGPAQIRDGIVGTDGVKPYNILILFSSLAYMAITLDITGLLQAAAFWVSNKGGSNKWKLYFYFYVMLTLLSVLLGNDPVILSGTVFLVYYTTATKLEPMSWLISEFAAANTASMVLFVGNPTNVVVCEGFAINNAAFTAYTILPFLACNVACYMALVLQFRGPKHLSKKMEEIPYLDPHRVLRDPFGAWVGSFLLASTLVVALVVSFFGVDVWKITLPFAGAKLIFDLAWDHYRYRRGIHHHPPENNEKEQETVDNDPQNDDPMLAEFQRAMSLPNEQLNGQLHSPITVQPPPPPSSLKKRKSWAAHFPTITTAFPRLPFALIPFAFSQFILIEALAHQGWIDVFAHWLAKASHGEKHPMIWLVGVLGVILCNVAGTNIGATILLTKVVRAVPNLPPDTTRAAGISLAVASNIGAVSFTFAASLAGLLWTTILKQKGITIKQKTFAKWNLGPIFVMTVVGLGVVSAEMAVLYG